MQTKTQKTARAAARGFTLIELMVVSVLLVIMVVFIYSLFLATLRTAGSQEAIIGMRDEARKANERTMQLMRGAVNISGAAIDGTLVPITNTGNTAVQVMFRYPEDIDGDFQVTDLAEYTGLMTLGLDINDANNDGRTSTQIILLDDEGDVLDVFSNRAVLPNNDGGFDNAPFGGFAISNTNNVYTVTTVLQDPGFTGGTPVTIRESRNFVLKNP